MYPRDTVTLSDKQRQVLALTDGRTIEEIAAELGWLPRTVKYHSDVLRRKYGVEKRRQLIPYHQEARNGQ